MGTISLCVLGLPICEFLPVPARMHTGAPRTRMAIGFDLSGEMHLSHERKGARTWGKEQATHTGIDQSLTICIMYSCAYGKLGI